MMDNKLSELKDVVDYWRKVKSGELPAPGPNEISITVCTLDGAVSRIAALLAELEAKDKRIAEAEVRGVEKLAAAFKSWASDETFPDCEAQRHWATASREALSFAGDLRNGSCDDR